jgi:hypothetical protein
MLSRQSIRYVITLLLAGACFSASANDTDWLLDQLRNPNDAQIGGSKAYSILIGITNGLTTYDAMVPLSSKPFCLPTEFNVESLTGAMQVYVTKHPEANNWLFTKTIGAALSETYPCTIQKTK